MQTSGGLRVSISTARAASRRWLRRSSTVRSGCRRSSRETELVAVRIGSSLFSTIDHLEPPTNPSCTSLPQAPRTSAARRNPTVEQRPRRITGSTTRTIQQPNPSGNHRNCARRHPHAPPTYTAAAATSPAPAESSHWAFGPTGSPARIQPVVSPPRPPDRQSRGNSHNRENRRTERGHGTD